MRKCTSQTEESWANQLKQFCEREIQTQMNASDGEVFVYEAMVFHGVGLTSFSKEAEVILEYFSGHGCPVSLARLTWLLYSQQSARYNISSMKKVVSTLEEFHRSIALLSYDPSYSNIFKRQYESQLALDIIRVYRCHIVSALLSDELKRCSIFQSIKDGETSPFSPRGVLSSTSTWH